jgi:phage terminase large subunit
MSSLEVSIPDAFHELYNPARYKIYYGGRGGAKSWNFAISLIVMGYQRPLRILCGREHQNSIAESVHKLLEQQIERLGLNTFYTVNKQSITGKNGTEFFFEGIKMNTAKIKSMEGIDICWLEEADKISDESWSIIIPTIRKAGSEIWCSFNTGYKYDPTYQRFVVNAPPKTYEGKPYCVVKKVGYQDNPWFPEELRIEMEQLKETDYESYLHIWEGELKSIAEGAIYAKQLTKAKKENRILDFNIEPSVEVHTFWDLGKNDTTAIWFMQNVGKEYRFIDYYENRLVDIDHYCRVIKGIEPGCERFKDYLYGTHFMPHDVEVELLGMTQTRKQQFESGGVRPINVVPRIPNINEGIEQTRKFMAHSYFHKTKCEEGLDRLYNYRYVFDEKFNTYRQTPCHDWASNGADAIRQAAQGFTPPTSWKPIVYPKQAYV